MSLNLRKHFRKLLDVEAHFSAGHYNADSVLVSKGNLIHHGLLYIEAVMCLAYGLINLFLGVTNQSLMSFITLGGVFIAWMLSLKGKVLASKVFNFCQLIFVIAAFFYLPDDVQGVHGNDSVLAFYIPISIGCLIAFQGPERKHGYLLAFITLLVMMLLLFFDVHYTEEYLFTGSGSQSPDLQLNLVGASLATVGEVAYILLLSNRMDDSLIKANRELDNFVYSVSHDLRSPLLLTRGMLDLAVRKKENAAEQERYLQLAGESIDKLDTIIREILAYSRNSRTGLQKEEFDLRLLIKETIQPLDLEARGEIRFIEEYQGDLVIFSDKGRLSTVLRNIIGNAAKYRKRDISDPFVHIKAEHKNGVLHLQITDNGEGIPKESQASVFDMFYRGTNSAQGTGLGLYICKEILQKLSAEFSIQSEKDKGTRFLINLPLNQP